MTTPSNPDRRAAADPSRCPLCGEPNGCALTAGLTIEACWCVSTPIPPAVLDRIPPERRRLACVCVRCAERGR